jgi:hypothetical protein
MNFNVPQFIDVEDKIAFQLTAKQLGWFAVGGVILFVFWQISGGGVAFIVAAIVVSIGCTLFAFLKPAGMTLFGFIISSIRYLFKPKVMVWRRKISKVRAGGARRKVEEKEHKINRFMKEKALKESADMADMLDRQSKI